MCRPIKPLAKAAKDGSAGTLWALSGTDDRGSA